MTRWPEPGRCGACTRPARRFPSGRWEHDGRPCALRSQGTFRVDDLPVRELLVFVPDGDDLPQPEPRWTNVVTEVDDTGFPSELGIVPPERQAQRWAAVRERPRAEAETPEPAD